MDQSSDIILQNLEISNNYAGYKGAGIHVYDIHNVKLHNVSFY